MCFVTHLILDRDIFFFFFPGKHSNGGKKNPPPQKKTFLLDYKAHSTAVKPALHSPIKSTNCHSGEAAERQRCSPVLLTCLRRELLHVSTHHPVPLRVMGSGHHLVPRRAARRTKQSVPCVAWRDSLDMPIIQCPYSQAF